MERLYWLTEGWLPVLHTNRLNSLAEALNQKFDVIIAPTRHLYSLLLDRSSALQAADDAQ